MCSTLFCTFLYCCFAQLQRETSRNFLVTHSWRKCHMCSCSFFFTAAHFHVPWQPLAFLIFPSPLQIPTKKCLLCLLSLTLFLVELRQPVAYFLFFSLSLYSKFVDITIFINLSLILQTTRIQKQFPLLVFVFIDSLKLSLLHKTRVTM